MIEEYKLKKQRIEKGGAERYHQKNKEKGKLFVRDRLHLLLDEDSFIEDAMFAECKDEHLPADGVVTGTGRMNGQTVCVMANDSTVKAGSWGVKTVEKIIRIQETVEAQLSDAVSSRFCGCKNHRSNRNVSRQKRSRAHFL